MIATLAGFATFVLMMFLFCVVHPLVSSQKYTATTGGALAEVQVNRLGYQLMGQNQLEAATELFKLNVEAYPQSFNVYDSLAEAYMNAGNNDQAIRFYEKSLELNPANSNAVQMLKKIRGS